MGNIYRLRGLKNSVLLAALSELVQRSNAITAEELAHLAEIEERMLHLELGFSSLFAYCVEAFGMSEGAAGRRVAAARVCRRFPEAFERVARGDLHLSALCALSPHLDPENASDLFESCRRKTRRQIEEVLAARFPKADVREQIRRLPMCAGASWGFAEAQRPVAVTGSNHEVTSAETAEFSSDRRVAPEREGPQVGAARLGTEAPRRREIEALAVDRFGVRFTADAELRELIEQARALASHRLPNGDLSSLMKLAFKTFVQREEKRRFAIGSKPRRARVEAKVAGFRPTPPPGPSEQPDGTRSTPPGEALARPRSAERTVAHGACSSRIRRRTRYVSAAVRREVYPRDERQCSFVSAGGRRCGARGFLQLNHIEPWAALGLPVARNIRILCRAHNLLHARNCFGSMHIAAKIAARRAQANDERTEM